MSFSRDRTVSELKGAIKGQKATAFNYIGADKLDIWKLPNPLSSNDIIKTLGETVDGSKIPGALQLGPMEKLSIYFLRPEPQKLHLVIQPPSTGQFAADGSIIPARGLSASNLGDLDSYQKSRTYLWGQNRIATFRLANGKDLPIIKLTPLNLLRLNPRNIEILLDRKEYELAYDRISESARHDRAVYLVTGQPGIGKTLFLLYLLVRLLAERRTVALQFSAKHYVLFNEQGAHIRKGTSPDASGILTNAWVLSDSMGGDEVGPCSAFRFSKTCLVHTSSPSAHNWSWTKQLTAEHHIMDLWSEEEFERLLTVSGSDTSRGLGLFRKYGSNIRMVTTILRKPKAEKRYIADVRAGAANFAEKSSEIFLDIKSFNYPSEIFAIRPDEDPQTAHLTIPTTFLQEILGEALSGKVAGKRHEAFVLLDSHPALLSAAGWVFELAGSHVLSPTRSVARFQHILVEVGPTIPAVNTMISGSTTIRYPFDFDWRPQEPNFPGVDALIRHKDDVWVLLYTISRRHGTPTDGLTEVSRLMNHNASITWHLVILGACLSDAQYVRSTVRLTGGWDKKAKVYASDLPVVGERWS